MPPLETHDRKQTAVLWAANGVDRFSQPKVAAPVELKVRWVPGERVILDSAGNKIAIDVTVIADRVIPPNSAMWLGTLASLGGGSPSSDIMEVVRTATTPSLKARFTRYEVFLRKWSDRMPELV